MNNKQQRRIINCMDCKKDKPSFYLGTCYSEITRRCKIFDPKRPNYFGKLKCTKEEFINKFLNDKYFLNQYKIWQENNYQRKFAPSIDRIDNNGDYLINNLQFIQHNENSKKDWQYNLKVISPNGKLMEFSSQLNFANYLGINDWDLSCILNKNNGVAIVKKYYVKRK